jgi:enamine deaminase RidA (YjgF/YER057c/UK114 family)
LARLAGLTPSARANLAIQKEIVSAALQIAGLGTEEILAWSPGEMAPRSFLEGMPETRVREDVMLATDFSVLPGFEAIKTHPFAAREFQGQGLDPRAHVPEHSAWAGTEIRKQTEFLIREKLEPALEAGGSSLERSLKAQIYLANIRDVPDFIDVWTEHFAAIPCAVTVVPTKSFATVGGIIEINLLALTNTATREKQVIEADIPGMAAYGPCIKCGEFLLPSGLMAIGHEGQVVGAALSPGFNSLAHAGYVQAAAVYHYAEALCRAAGTAMTNTLRAQYFVSDVTQFPGIAMAWAARFGAQPHPFICIQTPTAMPAPGAVLIGDFWISTVS